MLFIVLITKEKLQFWLKSIIVVILNFLMVLF